MRQVFFEYFPLYAPLSNWYMYIIFPFKELIMDLLKCVANIFCFFIVSSHVSISICKHFAMFLHASKDCYNRTSFFNR